MSNRQRATGARRPGLEATAAQARGWAADARQLRQLLASGPGDSVGARLQALTPRQRERAIALMRRLRAGNDPLAAGWRAASDSLPPPPAADDHDAEPDDAELLSGQEGAMRLLLATLDGHARHDIYLGDAGIVALATAGIIALRRTVAAEAMLDAGQRASLEDAGADERFDDEVRRRVERHLAAVLLDQAEAEGQP